MADTNLIERLNYELHCLDKGSRQYAVVAEAADALATQASRMADWKQTAIEYAQEIHNLRTALAEKDAMMADKIPDEIMREAARLLDRTHWDRSPTVERVARALMARDKRAAEIAESLSNAAHIAHDIREGIFPEQSDVRDAIAAAILAYGAHDEQR